MVLWLLKLANKVSEGYRTLRLLLRRSAAYLVTSLLLKVWSYPTPFLSAGRLEIQLCSVRMPQKPSVTRSGALTINLQRALTTDSSDNQKLNSSATHLRFGACGHQELILAIRNLPDLFLLEQII